MLLRFGNTVFFLLWFSCYTHFRMHTVADWANRLEWSFSLVEFIHLSVISSLNGLTRSWFCVHIRAWFIQTHISFKCDYLSPKNEQEKNTATQTAKTEQRVNEKNIHHTQSTNVYFFFRPKSHLLLLNIRSSFIYSFVLAVVFIHFPFTMWFDYSLFVWFDLHECEDDEAANEAAFRMETTWFELHTHWPFFSNTNRSRKDEYE